MLLKVNIVYRKKYQICELFKNEVKIMDNDM